MSRALEAARQGAASGLINRNSAFRAENASSPEETSHAVLPSGLIHTPPHHRNRVSACITTKSRSAEAISFSLAAAPRKSAALFSKNVFRMFSKMTGRRIKAESDGAIPLDQILRRGVRERPDVSALASLDTNAVCVMVWHYHDDDVSGPIAEVELTLSGLPLANGKAALEHFRIDDHHSNAFALWKEMGSPQNPTLQQYAELEERGRLTTLGPPKTIDVKAGRTTLEFQFPRQGVSLLRLTWKN